MRMYTNIFRQEESTGHSVRMDFFQQLDYSRSSSGLILLQCWAFMSPSAHARQNESEWVQHHYRNFFWCLLSCMWHICVRSHSCCVVGWVFHLPGQCFHLFLLSTMKRGGVVAEDWPVIDWITQPITLNTKKKKKKANIDGLTELQRNKFKGLLLMESWNKEIRLRGLGDHTADRRGDNGVWGHCHCSYALPPLFPAPPSPPSALPMPPPAPPLCEACGATPRNA